MMVEINGANLNVEVLGEGKGKPVLIAHHGGGGIGNFNEPKGTYGPLQDIFQVIVFVARGCGQSEIVGPYSHKQWAADVDGLRKWIGADKIVVAGGSYGGFISLEYAVCYPELAEAVMLRDTSADADNFKTLEENAKNQDRVEINWDNFNRYWTGHIRDDADLKACWAELIPLYDFHYDPVKSAARAIWPIKRMKGDEVLKAVAETGGVIGMSAAPHTTLSHAHSQHSIDSVMDHLLYCIDLVGIEHVAFGPDTLYGDHVGLHTVFSGLLKTASREAPAFEPVKYVDGLENPAEFFWNIAGWLVKNGFSDKDIVAILGGNIMRALKEIWVY
jgi:pimeloyl-ACP methyl ester carboxylesterase